MQRRQLFPARHVAALSALLVASCSTFPDRGDIDTTPDAAVPTIVSTDHRPLPAGAVDETLDEAAGSAERKALERLARAEEAATGTPLIAGNQVTLLVDGPQTLAAMFEAIRAARDHVHLESYILADDEVGHRLADLLIEKQRAGVSVRVIYDDVGSLFSSDEYFERMTDAGIALTKYGPITPTSGLHRWRVNQRDHRKILVVDGSVACTGGVNISRTYSSSSSLVRRRPPEEKVEDGWRDTHVCLRGPAVAGFQRLFLETWRVHADEDLQRGLPDASATPPVAGDDLVRVLGAEGDDDSAPIYNAYLSAIANAEHRVWITQAYFAPDGQLLEALKKAARRGVDVRILLPGVTDSRLLRLASQAHYDELLEAGVRLFELDDALLHAKTAVVDGVWSTVGSSNLDHRSFLHNDEANLVVLGYEFGRQMEGLFREDLANTRPVTLETWRSRPWVRRVGEALGSLFDYWL